MRVYLCVNRELGLLIMQEKRFKHKESLTCPVYTQKKKAIKAFPQEKEMRKNIRERLTKNHLLRIPVIIFLLDISEKYLTYISGDRLDPYTTEYSLEMDTEFSLPIKRINVQDILSLETTKVFFLDKHNRLKCKKALSILPRMG